MDQDILTLEDGKTLAIEQMKSGTVSLVCLVGSQVVKIIPTQSPKGMLLSRLMDVFIGSGKKVSDITSFLQGIMDAFQVVGYGVSPVNDIRGGKGNYVLGKNSGPCIYLFQKWFEILDEHPTYSPHPFFSELDHAVLGVRGETDDEIRNVLLDWDAIIFNCLMYLRNHTYHDMLAAIRERRDVLPGDFS